MNVTELVNVPIVMGEAILSVKLVMVLGNAGNVMEKVKFGVQNVKVKESALIAKEKR